MSDIRSPGKKRAVCRLPRRSVNNKPAARIRLKWERSEWPPGCIYMLCRLP